MTKFFTVRKLTGKQIQEIIKDVGCAKIATMSSLYQLGRLTDKRVESLEEVETSLGTAHIVCWEDITMQVLEKYLLPA